MLFNSLSVCILSFIAVTPPKLLNIGVSVPLTCTVLVSVDNKGNTKPMVASDNIDTVTTLLTIVFLNEFFLVTCIPTSFNLYYKYSGE